MIARLPALPAPPGPPAAHPEAGTTSVRVLRITSVPSPTSSPMLSVRTAASENVTSPRAGATNENVSARAPQSDIPTIWRGPATW